MRENRDDLEALCRELVRCVEGPGCLRYAANGPRLKDTPEWVQFYVAVRRLDAPINLIDVAREATQHVRLEAAAAKELSAS